MKFNRKKRAISYIMEVVMMTLVITALSSVVLTWGISTIGESRTALTGAVNSRMNRIQEGLIIEDVQMINQTSARVWVRNAGSIQVVVDQVYFNNFQTAIIAVCTPGQSPSGAGAGTCPTTTTKLSLPIQSVGAVDVTVSDSISVSIISGTATSGTTITLVDSTKSWTTDQWANCKITITGGASASSTAVPITSNDSTAVTVGSWPGGTPTSTSLYTISSAGMCSGGTYSVTASTTRGTTAQGSFTV